MSKKFVLACKVSEETSASTSQDVGVYTWNQSEICLFNKIRSVYNGAMVKFIDQKFNTTFKSKS